MTAQASSPAIRSVLLVDDSAAQRAYAVALCHELGITEVLQASNGQEALALLASLPVAPDLLIIDLEMPTMDGPELLTRLRERGLESPIIVASSRERSLLHSVQDMGGGMGLCILGALQKPLRLEGLSAILRNWDSVADKRKQSAGKLPLDPEALRAGIDRGEIVIHYQPQIRVQSGDVHGVEALARWNHPTLGLVSPDQFIPLAEESGLIVPIGEWVLRDACRQLRVWQDLGLPTLRVAVNISALQFRRLDLVDTVRRALADTGLAAKYLEIELTETAVMSDPEESVDTLERLSRMGVIVSVDDFGTGYSSMSYLRRFPIDKLKIDRSFITNVMTSADDASIVQAIISLAHGLRLKVVAEGVETADQVAFLQKLGCDQYQGYYFSLPVSAAAFEAMLRGPDAPEAESTANAAERTHSRLAIPAEYLCEVGTAP